METIICIPKEEDLRRWTKENVKELLFELKPNPSTEDINSLISRADTATMLKVPLTFTAWIKRGLPRHKQRVKVYFVKSEVLDLFETELRHFAVEGSLTSLSK